MKYKFVVDNQIDSFRNNINTIFINCDGDKKNK